MQCAQRRQQYPHLAGDLHDGQADAPKGAQQPFGGGRRRGPRGLPRIEASDQLLGGGEVPARHEFHQDQHPQGQAQQPDQALHPRVGLQEQGRDRQRLALEAAKTPLDQRLPPIDLDGGRHRQGRVVGGIDSPAQPLPGCGDGQRGDPRPNRALALHPMGGWARAQGNRIIKS